MNDDCNAKAPKGGAHLDNNFGNLAVLCHNFKVTHKNRKALGRQPMEAKVMGDDTRPKQARS